MDYKDIDHKFLQWFVGFSDAESAFMINIKNNKEVHFVFQITLHIADVAVLYTIQNKLGIGVVSIRGTTASYRVHSFQKIVEYLLPIFDQFPLLSTKHLNYLKWRKAYILIQDKLHLTDTGLKKIIRIKQKMNNNNSEIID